MKKIIKYILVVAIIGLVGYKSVYFRKLSEVNTTGAQTFDAVAYAEKLWHERLPLRLDSATELTSLITSIEADPSEAFARFSNALGIGNYRYSLVKFTGVASAINEDDIATQVNHADSLLILKVATEYIYGNAIRDASRLVDIKDFSNTSDLNNISEELNKKVRTEVLPPFKKQVKQGDSLEVSGAVEFNKEHFSLKDVEIIPVRIKILK
jgi:predicted lipoprotein